MKEKRTVVITVRLPESIGKEVERIAEQERRKVSSLVALMVEDAVKARLAAEKPAKGRKP